MDLNNLSKAELISLCKEKNIKGYSKLRKDEIISLINSSFQISLETYLRSLLSSSKKI